MFEIKMREYRRENIDEMMEFLNQDSIKDNIVGLVQGKENSYRVFYKCFG